jgi:hypothetical protein
MMQAMTKLQSELLAVVLTIHKVETLLSKHSHSLSLSPPFVSKLSER